ncbi:hypothetical protein BES34_018815 [Leptospira inadai serovar Lyme]|nr:hypothetical protein BES34_018815 [Leptospira inadai serovar Lyme]
MALILCTPKDPVKSAIELNKQGADLLPTNPKQALSKFIKASQLNPKLAEYRANAGIAYMTMDQKEDALRKFGETIQIDPKYLQAYYNSGVILESLGRHKEAIQNYKAALKLTTDDTPEILYNLALSYENSEQKEEAIQSYSKFIKIAPASLQPAIEEAKARIQKLQGKSSPDKKRIRKLDRKRKGEQASVQLYKEILSVFSPPYVTIWQRYSFLFS